MSDVIILVIDTHKYIIVVIRRMHDFFFHFVTCTIFHLSFEFIPAKNKTKTKNNRYFVFSSSKEFVTHFYTRSSIFFSFTLSRPQPDKRSARQNLICVFSFLFWSVHSLNFSLSQFSISMISGAVFYLIFLSSYHMKETFGASPAIHSYM